MSMRNCKSEAQNPARVAAAVESAATLRREPGEAVTIGGSTSGQGISITDKAGNLTKSTDLAASLPRRFRYVTATASSPASDPSEFSACIPLAFVNHRPDAVCGPRTVRVTEGCSALISFDAGSYDPDGDPFTLTLTPTQTPPPPRTAATHAVTLVVTDSWGRVRTPLPIP
jgi:hypothetical protein